MSNNSHFAYAVHTLTFLASFPEPQSSTFIAASIKTNPVTVRKLIGLLREGGLVETTHGSTGGAMLKKAPSQITLGEIYQLVKEETPFGLHPTPPAIECLIGRNIQGILERIFAETDSLIARALMKISIQDILDEVLQKEGLA
jgi:Rrf2 family protein